MKKIQTNYGGEKLIFVYRKWGGGEGGGVSQ